jgi:hypothetical protein
MDDNMMFEYLLQQGAMRPEEEQMMRRQDTIDALRNTGMQSPQAQQAGRAVVAPSWTQNLAQIGAAAAGKYGQKKLDKQYDAFNTKRGNSLMGMRNRASAPGVAGVAPPSQMPDGADDFLQRMGLPGYR